MIDGSIHWTCICGRENPPGRDRCSQCNNPMF